MELNAKISTTLNQVMVFKQMSTGAYRISMSDAKWAYLEGNVHKSNAVFKRLVENKFDARKTMDSYLDDKQRLAEEHS